MFFQNRKQGFNQMRPKGNVVRSFGGFGGMKRQQFRRPGFGNNMYQRQNQQGGMMQRQNFNPMRRNFNNFNNGGFQQRNQGFVQQVQQFRRQPFNNNPFMGTQMRYNNRPQQQQMQQNQNRSFGNNMMNKPQTPPTKLYISNLDFGVTNTDLKELFFEFGPMVRYGVNFSAAGRSVGSGEILFRNHISAVKAFQKYNGVTLDGRPMKLEVSGGPQQQQRTQQMQNRPQQQQGQQFRPKMQMRVSPMKRLMNNRPGMMMNKQFGKFNKKPGGIANQLVNKAKFNMMKKGQMGGKKQMMMKGTPDASQLDADLEAYANSKD